MTDEGSTSGICLWIAYDGKDFSGWQAQQGQRTVQEEIASAVRKMTSEQVTIRGASRTDAQVHAYGQVASFTTAKSIEPEGWLAGLNTHLPRDIAITRTARCPADFNPRFEARRKTYQYLVRVGNVPDPLLRGRAWQIGRSRGHPSLRRGDGDTPIRLLDLEAMKNAATALEGRHSFHAFRAASDERQSTERTLDRVQVTQGHGGNPRMLCIEVTGDAFLKNMVRIIVGTLLDVGRGRIQAHDVRGLLDLGSTRRQAGETAPGFGLYLMQVELRATLKR